MPGEHRYAVAAREDSGQYSNYAFPARRFAAPRNDDGEERGWGRAPLPQPLRR
jgi:hypothetical protein